MDTVFDQNGKQSEVYKDPKPASETKAYSSEGTGVKVGIQITKLPHFTNKCFSLGHYAKAGINADLSGRGEERASYRR